MTLRELIVSDFKTGLKFLNLCALFDRPALPQQIS
jgi:hypothetical protein